MGEAMAQKQKEAGSVIPVKIDKHEEKYIAEFLKVTRKDEKNKEYSDEELQTVAKILYKSGFEKSTFSDISEMLAKKKYSNVKNIFTDLESQGLALLAPIEESKGYNKSDLKKMSSYDAIALQYTLYSRHYADLAIDGKIGGKTLKEMDSYLFMKTVVRPAIHSSFTETGISDGYYEYLKGNELKSTRKKTDLLVVAEFGEPGVTINFTLENSEMRKIQNAVDGYRAEKPSGLEDVIFRYAYSSHGSIAPDHVKEAMLYMICYGQNTRAFQLKKGPEDSSSVYTMNELAELMKTKKGKDQIIRSFQAFENDRVKEAIERGNTEELERMKNILTLLARTWLPNAKGGTGSKLFGVKEHYVEGSLTDMLREWDKIQRITDSTKKLAEEAKFMGQYFGKDTEPIKIDGILGPQTILSMLFFITPPPPEVVIPVPTPVVTPEPMFVVSMLEKQGWATANKESATFKARLTVADEKGELIPYRDYLKRMELTEENSERAFYGVYVLQDRKNPECWFIVNPNVEERKERKTLSAYFDATTENIYAVDYEENGDYTIQRNSPLLKNVKMRHFKQGDLITAKFNFGMDAWSIDEEVAKRLFISPDKVEGDTATFTIPNYPSKEKHLIVNGTVRKKTGGGKTGSEPKKAEDTESELPP